ncbi:hypothetical protein B0H17DRAFT_1109157 [Mycena rosella]|uniref:Uncharacterized protein n=1 Tax=Mycena rosella TaxID=1033263 RepID=A0AAD7FPA1_MYCRO|nr:hypothetical protein B0H17DRAFT_1109157 [Mycena rosella]
MLHPEHIAHDNALGFMSDDDGETCNRFHYTDTHPTQPTACCTGVVRPRLTVGMCSRPRTLTCDLRSKRRARRSSAALHRQRPNTGEGAPCSFPPLVRRARRRRCKDVTRVRETTYACPRACTRPCARDAPPVRGAFAALQGRAYRARDLALPSHLRSRAAAAPAAAQTHVASARPCPYPSPYSAAATPRLPSLALAHPWYCYLSALACNTSVCRRRIRVRVRNL